MGGDGIERASGRSSAHFWAKTLLGFGWYIHAVLIGRRIRLSEYASSDAALLADWMNDPAYWGAFYNVWTSTEEQWQAQIAAQDGDGAEKLSFLIRGGKDDRPLGTAGYFTPYTLNAHRALEIWYQVHPNERGKGVATEAAAILTNHLFSALPIARVQATSIDGNEASCRVMERIGMQHEGFLRDVSFLRGRWVGMHIYSIVRSDWQSESEYEARFPEVFGAGSSQ
jgi:RimJ/RimL family protein N-acetyltransferase